MPLREVVYSISIECLEGEIGSRFSFLVLVFGVPVMLKFD